MTRNVIPIDRHRSQIANTETAQDSRTSFFIGTLLVLLHVASVALALTYL